jgi:hypothetical protein
LDERRNVCEKFPSSKSVLNASGCYSLERYGRTAEKLTDRESHGENERHFLKSIKRMYFLFMRPHIRNSIAFVA